MIYVVSGQRRTGTSAMMRALIAGGLEGFYDEPTNQSIANRVMKDGYKPNPYGNFEATRSLPPDDNDRVVKILGDALLNFHRLCRVVYMRRAEQEVNASRERCDDHGSPYYDTHEHQLINSLAYDCVNVQHVFEVWYPQLIVSPRKVFTRLVELDWPINPNKAARAIDPTLYRHIAKQATT